MACCFLVRYDEARVPAFDTMADLLMNIKEIKDISTTGSVAGAGSSAARAEVAAAIGVPVTSIGFGVYLT